MTYPHTVDFISTMDTPYPWELNIWYHTLNVGFRTRISGETDFPCITDARVGQGRVYAKVDGPLSYKAWLDSVREGRSYVSDGRSHLMDFRVNGLEVGARLGKARPKISPARWIWPRPAPSTYGESRCLCSMLSRPGDSEPAFDQQPYWHIERARIGDTREVPVELIVNGQAVARQNLTCRWRVRDITFDVPIEKSSWVALRIFALLPHQSHLRDRRRTNPFAPPATAPSGAWPPSTSAGPRKRRRPQKRNSRMPSKAYNHARDVYKKLIQECSQ